MPRAPILLRLKAARQMLFKGSVNKDYIPALSPLDGRPDSSGRLKDFNNRGEQVAANLNWCYTANKSIVDPAGSVELKVYRKKGDGTREEANDAKARELLDLLQSPNNVHTWEQTSQLHYTYMNFVGEGYTMMFRSGQPWVPTPGQLPHALQEIPAHQVQFKLSPDGYSKSTVRYMSKEYQLGVFIRDLNPDPSNPFTGMGIIAAASAIINADLEAREFNNRVIANGAAPGLVFSSNETLSDESYNRWKDQFADEHTGATNAGKPLLIENGDVKALPIKLEDLQFLDSRKFTRDEILAMWRVHPAIIGSVEDVNLANAKAARIQHAEINIEPRVRQWVRQLNATMVSVFDPNLEIGYEDIVPEDIDAKITYHQAAINKWETPDEARADFGEEELPDELGSQLYVSNTLQPISVAAASSAPPADDGTAPGGTAPGDAEQDDGTDDPENDGATKSLSGVKKKLLAKKS